MGSWDSNSETSGTPNPPTPSVGQGRGGPTPDSSDSVGFGHNWTPPASGVDRGGTGFDTPSTHNNLPWSGGDSQSK